MEDYRMTDDSNETPSTTPNFQTDLAAQLAELMPEVIADGKVDVAKLNELLGSDTADPSERFGLFWPGKKRALRAAQEPTTATLRPDFENSKDWDITKNVFIEGDNLEVLKILQKHYHAKIKMIYIDPPYNTGKDFVYPDNFKEGLDTYLEWTRQVNEEGKKVSTNAETEGRYHSNWLNMMYPRLKLARNLLTEDGLLAISIDDGEHAGLVAMVREIFGEDNCLASIARVSKKTSNKGMHFAPSKDFVVVAARNASALPPLMDEVPDEYRKKFSERDTRGLFATVGLYQASLDPLRGCSNQRYWIEAPDGTFVLPPGPNRPADVADGSNRSPETREDRVWRWSFESYLRQKDLLVFKKTSTSPLQDPDGNQSIWNVYTKYYLEDRLKDGIRPRDFVDNLTNDLGTKALISLGLGNFFDFAKPPQLITKLLTWINDPSASVMDFFAGSATTAHAVMKLNADDGGNRRFIMVQLPEPTPDGSEARRAGFSNIAQLSQRRIRLAGDAIAGELQEQVLARENPLDIGFRTFKLSDTSFQKWRTSSEVDEDALQQRLLELRDSSSADDATPDDLLVEILLKQGYSLTEKIAQVEIAGLDIRVVGDNFVAAYLDEHLKPTLDQFREVIDTGPQRFIVLEDAFHGDDELKTNLAQLAKSKGIELWTA
jgi:adenine-specific DNA-methyltransferase